jgi:sugar lactone lactonase YvrE
MVGRIFLIGALAVLASGCETTTSTPSGPQPATLAPGPVIRGATLGAGPFTPLRMPVAVAAAGPDLYVADAGPGALLRIDPVALRMVQLTARPFVPGTRLAVDLDGSVYVLDPVSRRIQRFGRDGRLLQTFNADATVASLRDLVPDPARGRLVGVDSLNRQLVAFRPLGGAFELLALRGEPRYTLQSLDALAVAADALYAIDARCGCLARIAFDGRVLETFGHGELRRPERLAADRDGRLYVSDRADRTIKVFRGARLLESIELARFAILEASDLAFSEGWLYVADAPGGQVRMLRVQPPAKASTGEPPGKP